MDCGSMGRSAFERWFVLFKGDFVGVAGRQDMEGSSGITADCDLAETDHAIAEIGKYWNQHDKMLVNFTLGNGHVEFHLPAVARTSLIFQVVSQYPRTIHPLLKKPFQAAIFGPSLRFGIVFLRLPFESLCRSCPPRLP